MVRRLLLLAALGATGCNSILGVHTFDDAAAEDSALVDTIVSYSTEWAKRAPAITYIAIRASRRDCNYRIRGITGGQSGTKHGR